MKSMNHLASQSYIFRTIADHLIHEEHRKVRGEYGDNIKWAKEQHWKGFLEEITGMELWESHHYVSNPVGDGGKVRIPTLQVIESSRVTRSISSNKEKGAILSCMFFPEKPAQSLVPTEAEYPDQVTYSFRPTMAQLRCCIMKLSPHKHQGRTVYPI